jgi:hypothetical protein
MLPPIETKEMTAENDLEDLMKRVRGAIAEELCDSGQLTTDSGQQGIVEA